MQGRKFIIEDGKKILFWKDRWLYDQPLNFLFPDLFKMAQQHDMSNVHLSDCTDVVTWKFSPKGLFYS